MNVDKSRVFLFLLGFLGLLFILLPQIICPGTRPPSARSECAHSMRFIAIALHKYADEHKGELPDDLFVLVEEDRVELQYLLCPEKLDQYDVSDGKGMSREEFGKVMRDSAYRYFGKGKNLKLVDPEKVLISCDFEAHEGEGTNLMIGDLSVRFLTRKTALEWLKYSGIEIE